MDFADYAEETERLKTLVLKIHALLMSDLMKPEDRVKLAIELVEREFKLKPL